MDHEPIRYSQKKPGQAPDSRCSQLESRPQVEEIVQTSSEIIENIWEAQKMDDFTANMKATLEKHEDKTEAVIEKKYRSFEMHKDSSIAGFRASKNYRSKCGRSKERNRLRFS